MAVILPSRTVGLIVDSRWGTIKIESLKKVEECWIEGVPCVVDSRDMRVCGMKDTTDSH